MELTLAERGRPEGRLVLEQGQLVGRAYRVEPKICGNPVCECKQFSLHCFPETTVATVQPTPLTLELDLGQRALVKPEISEASPASALAKEVMDEMTLEQWHYLWNYFYTLKILYTERANLDELDTHFPANASEGAMVGF